SLRNALALAAQSFERPIPEGSEIVVYSDGTFDEPLELRPMVAPVRFVKVGQNGNNQGVSRLEVRRSPGEAPRLEGFARVTNYADATVRIPVRLTADGLLLETRLVDLPTRGRAELPFEVPSGAKSVGVALEGRDT